MSGEGKFVSPGSGTTRSADAGVWLPLLVLAQRLCILLPPRMLFKNSQNRVGVFFASDPEKFLGSWLKGLDKAFTLPQVSGKKDLQSIFASCSEQYFR